MTHDFLRRSSTVTIPAGRRRKAWRWGRVVGLAALVVTAFPPAQAAELADLSLEELSALEVVSVSRKAQRLADTPAAVTVITADDIRHSGARSIPEALRLVPGVQVARIGAGRWAVSVRGFNSRFASRLLVQIDGRSIYSPMFSGVTWTFETLMLEDVARIEVVRGPGASLWGANAVNGVINIVTRRATETPDALVRLSVDDSGRPEMAVRQGFGLGEAAAGRVFALSINRAPYERADGRSIEDEQTGWRTGFRIDSIERDRWRVSGEVFRQRSPEIMDLPTPGALSAVFDYEGAHVLGAQNWAWLGGEAMLRGYVDYLKMTLAPLATPTVITGDLDFQHRLAPRQRHEWIWGVGLRYQNADTESYGTLMRFQPSVTQQKAFSAFVQDEISLVPKRWRLSLGARFEARNDEQPEWQPSVRLMWTPNDRDSVWINWSRASREPSISELDASLVAGVRNIMGLPVTVRSEANPRLEPEHLQAVELGFRRQLDVGSVEAVVFRHRYTDMIGTGGGALMLPPAAPAPTMYLVRNNDSKAVTEGLELSAEARLSRSLRLLLAYTALRVHFEDTGDPVQDGSDAVHAQQNPNHWLTLQGRFDLPRDQTLDLTLRHVGALGALAAEKVGTYTVLDANFSRRFSNHFELSLAVSDLFNEHHTEFNSDRVLSPYGYGGRRAVLTGRWQF